MKSVKQIKLFISCPGDIKEELNSIQLIINEINKTSGRQNDYILELLNWKFDTYTDIASDAQEVINNQIDEHYDILVSILWTKAGTPTTRYKSGTIEEINRALDNKSKEQLIYFRTSGLDNIYHIDLEQLNILKSFKTELSNRGVLYKEYDSIETFEQLFRINLTNLITDKILSKKQVNLENINNTEKALITIPIVSNKYSDIYSLIDEVESKDENNIDTDIFTIVEEATSYLNNVTFSLDSMTGSLTFFTQRVNKRTKEITKYNTIKDNALRKIKVLSSVNLLADEMLDFNSRIDDELPLFSENLKSAAKSYSDIILISSKNSPEIMSLKVNIRGLRDAIKSAVDSNAEFLKVIMNLPLINSNFNNSKRQSEITIKNLIKETLNGLLLFDALLDD